MNLFLPHLHTDLRRARLTKRGATHHPDTVPKGVHKEYPRMHTISLPEPEHLPVSLYHALEKRQSGHGGNPHEPVLLGELGTLLGLALRKRQHVHHRNYPSGGALYPIETYLISTALESQEPSVYHYNPTKHALELLWELPPDFSIKDVAKQPESLPLSTLIVFTAVWERSSAKYGDLAYLHALLEAGHMSENILLVGCALDLDVRPYAGFNDTLIERLLDLDEECEQSVHTVTVCKNTT